MSLHPQGDRRFSKKDLREIIQRASRLAVEDAESDDETLSLAEVEDIAEDLGIDRDHLHRALFSLGDDARPTGISRLWGAPFSQTSSTSLPAHVSDEEWTEIIHILRNITGKRGAVEHLGDLREWRYSVSDGKMTLHSLDVSVQSSEGQTIVQADTSYGGGAAFSYLLSVLVGITLAGILGDGTGLSDLPGFVLAGSGGAVGAAAARVGISMWARRQRERLNRVVSSLSGFLSSGASKDSTISNAKATSQTGPPLDIEDAGEFLGSDQEVINRLRNRSK